MTAVYFTYMRIMRTTKTQEMELCSGLSYDLLKSSVHGKSGLILAALKAKFPGLCPIA
jgi:hypothetical protein